MRFFTDSPLAIRVRWYFADADAKVFPGYTRFASGNWAEDREDWPGVGEVLGASRDWTDGSGPEGYIGDHFCGPESVYAKGVAYPGVPLNGLDDGRCTCCLPIPPPCADVLDALPDRLVLRITRITLIPLGVTPAEPSRYHVGQEIDLIKDEFLGVWVLADPVQRWFCTQTQIMSFRCAAPPGDEPFPTTLLSVSQVTGALLAPIRYEPFLASYATNITTGSCAVETFGQEIWEYFVFDPDHPPS